VSHDRYFLDNVANNLFVFEDKGVIKNFPGNYSQYIEYENNQIKEKIQSKPKLAVQKEKIKEEKPRKLTFKEKQELEYIEETIKNLDIEKKSIENELNSSMLLPERLKELSIRLNEIINEIPLLENRWFELSEKSEP
jgi:ATP-binding cassette subfamily F protein uup